MSDTHEARIIRIGEVRPHPNADKLELTNIGGPEGYQMVIGKGAFKTGDGIGVLAMTHGFVGTAILLFIAAFLCVQVIINKL